MRDFLIKWYLIGVMVAFALVYIAGVVALCVWLFPFIGFWGVLAVFLVAGVSCSIAVTHSRGL